MAKKHVPMSGHHACLEIMAVNPGWLLQKETMIINYDDRQSETMIIMGKQ